MIRRRRRKRNQKTKPNSFDRALKKRKRMKEM